MSAITGDLGARSPSATNAFSAMSSEDFVEIMFTELTNQDPLQPNDTQALLSQIDTIRSIESDQAMTATLQQMVHQNEVTAASGLIGKFVTGLTDAGLRAASYVDSVSVTREGTILNLNSGVRIPLDNVDEIIDPQLLEDLFGGGDDGDGGGKIARSGGHAAAVPIDHAGAGDTFDGAQRGGAADRPDRPGR